MMRLVSRECGIIFNYITSYIKNQFLYTRSFDEDTSQHGAAYARYKQKMIREFYEDDLEEEEEDNE